LSAKNKGINTVPAFTEDRTNPIAALVLGVMRSG